MSRRVTWILLLVLLLAPVLGTVALSAQPSLAQDEITTETTDQSNVATDPTVEPTATEEITPEPSPTDATTPEATPSETPTDSVTPAETPVETPTGEASPTATPTATPTESATVQAAAVVTPAEIAITTLNCTAPVESFRVTNGGAANATITGIVTLANPVNGEPFVVSRTLKPGQTGLFQSGPGAQYGTVVSLKEIFTNALYEQDGLVLHIETGSVATNDLTTFDVSRACPKAPQIDPWVSNPGKLSDLKITLSCTTNAESIRVQNTGNGYILIKGIATYYDPGPAEPFSLNRVLRPGQGALYQAGAGAKYGTVLTNRFIFTNSVWEKDGVRVQTSAGKAYKACAPKPLPPEHWVEVDLSMQYLWAWEGNKVVNQTYVSTGKAGFETPTGTFYILVKYRYDTMAGTIGGETYYVPDVPWTMYFTNYGHALHGAYWHNDFGTPRSHGCVNLPLWFAEWLYYWLPYGGRVYIHY